MKKILIVANVAKEHILKFHIPIIKRLKQEGWVVHVACSGEEDVPFCDKKWKMSYKRNPISFKTFTGISQLNKIINKENYDVIHCHTPTGGLVGRVAAAGARKHGTKVLYTVHGFHFFKGASFLNWAVFFPIEKILARFTDAIITINSEDYDNALKFGFKTNIEKSNGMGVDLKKFAVEDRERVRSNVRKELGIPDDAVVLIYIAELIKNKNQSFLIDVFEKVKSQHNNLYLMLVGPDHAKGYYQNYAKSKGFEKEVKFLGWRNDCANLLAGADVCTPTSFREGLATNVIEAMAAGVPVTAVDNRGHCDIIKSGENGFMVKQNDADDMAEKILKIINSEELKDKFIKKAHQDVEKYDINQTLQEVLDIYDKYL